MGKQKLFEVDNYTVWQFSGQNTFFFNSGRTIDADGLPNAYNPDDTSLDNLEHVGESGNWWGIVTDNGEPDGEPVVQGDDDPYLGYYISRTALEDETKDETDPRRYVDSTKIPYIVLPENENKKFLKKAKVKLGDFADVYSQENDKFAFAIFAFAIFADTGLEYADSGEEWRLGEGFIALAELLNIHSSLKERGTDEGLLFSISRLRKW
ncbi:glycoside hydrolase family 75 protein [Microcoleus sp. F8_C2]